MALLWNGWNEEEEEEAVKSMRLTVTSRRLPGTWIGITISILTVIQAKNTKKRPIFESNYWVSRGSVYDIYW